MTVVVLVAAGIAALLASGGEGVAIATVLGSAAAVVALGPAIYQLWCQFTRVGHEKLAEEARELAGKVLEQAILDQRSFLDEPGWPEPADIKFDRPEFATWRSSTDAHRGSLKHIHAFYTGLHHGRLVMLGGAGSGKTVLANQLIIDLIEKRSVTDPPSGAVVPVPIRLSLAAFQTDGSEQEMGAVASKLDAWIASELVKVWARSPTVAKTLVRRGWILPVLDGLDEMDSGALGGMEPEIQELGRARNVIHALNYPTDGRPRPVVVTCRTDRYMLLATSVDASGHPVVPQDATTIQMERLTANQVAAYITARFKDYSRDGKVQNRWRVVIHDLKSRPAGSLAITLGQPLWLFMAVTAYLDVSSHPRELTELEGDDLDHHLISHFIRAVTRQHRNPSGSRYESEEVSSRLDMFARHLETQQRRGGSGSDLELDHLWEAAGRRIPRYLTGALYGIVVGGLLLLITTWYLWSTGHLLTPTDNDRFIVEACSLVAASMMWRASRHDVVLSRLPPLPTARSRRMARDLGRSILNALSMLAVGVALGISGWQVSLLGAETAGRHAAEITSGLIGTAILCLAVWWARGRTGWRASVSQVALIGLYVGVGLWLGLWSEFGPRVWLIAGLTVLIGLFALNLGQNLTEQPSAIRHPSKLITEGLRYDLTVGFAHWIIFVFAGFAAGLLGIGLVPGLAAGMALGLAMAALWTADSPWPRYFVVTSILAPKDKLPERPAQFLDWAYSAGLMRLSGISVQFRHTKIQEFLLTTTPQSRQRAQGMLRGARWRTAKAAGFTIAGVACIVAVLVGTILLPQRLPSTLSGIRTSQLNTGDCLSGSIQQNYFNFVKIVTCTKLHLGEVYFSDHHYWPQTLKFPLSQREIDTGMTQCDKAFRTYVGIDYHKQNNSQGKFIAREEIIPDSTDWDLDKQRGLVCVAYRAAPLYKSIKGTR